MNIYKVLPSLTKTKHLALWHKGIRAQWAPTELDWERADGRPGPGARDELARVLTPILMGEQAALHSVTTMIQVMGREADVESQFYLTTMVMDEARHTELFARYYHRIEREPLSIRRFQSGYLFQSKIMSTEPSEWLTGSLISEVIAKLAMERLRDAEVDPVLTELCSRTLEDEARHLGFNHVFLEDRSQRVFEKAGAEAEELWADQLRARLEEVLETVPPMLEELGEAPRGVGIDPVELHDQLVVETRRRLEKAIESGRRRSREDIAGS